MSNYEKLRAYCIEKGVITIDCTCLCGHEELDHRSHHGIFRGECEHGDGCKEFRVDANKPQMQIADVLRGLALTNNPYGNYFLHDNGWLMHTEVKLSRCEGVPNEIVKQICRFDLSLPLSHPDNDEACGKVLSLLTNNKDNEVR